VDSTRFHQGLPDEPATSGSQREPDDRFAPRSAAPDRALADVGAGDQEEQPDRHLQREQRCPKSLTRKRCSGIIPAPMLVFVADTSAAVATT
jgi:hypothetical protein